MGRYYTLIDALKDAIRKGRPVKFDTDYVCNVCGELWDIRGVLDGLDMTETERKRFLAGKGCPVCKGRKSEIVLELERELREGSGF
ncbi:MAG: hypothetical protein QXR17_08735 [Candidatus Bathyarchaeia archaeon]